MSLEPRTPVSSLLGAHRALAPSTASQPWRVLLGKTMSYSSEEAVQP